MQTAATIAFAIAVIFCGLGIISVNMRKDEEFVGKARVIRFGISFLAFIFFVFFAYGDLISRLPKV